MTTSSPGPAPRRLAPLRRLALRALAPAAVLGALAWAITVLHRQLRDYPWDRLGPAIGEIGAIPVLLAVVATGISYLAMTGYDALALRYVEHPLPYRRFAAASFVATAFGNTLGASAVVGAALRARVYSAWGVPAFAITRIAVFNLVTLSLGCGVLAAAGVAHTPDRIGPAVHLPSPLLIAIAVVLVVAIAGYVLWCGAGKAPISVRAWRIDRPTRRLAGAQLVLSTVEWLSMAAVLYLLLPDGGLGFATFATVFVVATVAGLMSNVPGGLGVFEAVLLIGMDSAVASEHLVTALVAYRIIYFLAPLSLAAVLLAVLEARRSPTSDGAIARIGVLTPSVMGLSVAVLGVVLVISGRLPGYTSPADLTAFSASLAGVGLLLLARGLHRRLRGALVASLGALTVVLTAALQGATVVPATVAALLIVVLVLARKAFDRTTSVLSDPRGWAWSLTVAGICSVLVWWHDLWVGSRAVGGRTWLAASLGDATPVSVRVGLSAGVLGLVVAGTRLQTSGRPGHAIATEAELALAEPILARARTSDASLLWTGDKRVHFSPRGGALLMYQVRRRSWVVMGDPVGEEAEFDELLWSFLDLCDRNLGRPVFYCVHEEVAELYRRHGLTLSKLGEEAVIDLAGFTMQGKNRAKLRSEVRSSERVGVSVEIVEPDRVREVLPELRVVSDTWLEQRNAREKTFSLGAFDEDYLVRFPIAIARQDGAVVAFASLWASGARHEIKVDLMRRLPDAPRCVMSHLFVAAMTWAQEQGFASFSIGMAPLSGLVAEDGYWDRIGHFLFSHGEHFYNFQGLRQFKERFHPLWQPRYVASPGGPALPSIMLDVATLVGGGLRGVVAR
ncbi:MAG: bifunctional lysylphosphatidylglycerol flippase/synthetase MprF [Kineosporiaceae bacterium]|nr:bifunctional lysylphosphatidylglycerol flippase/synthetase MprF [Kineosporiaceae bacterium]